MKNYKTYALRWRGSGPLFGVAIALIFCQGCLTPRVTYVRPSFEKKKETTAALDAREKKITRDTAQAEEDRELEDLNALLASPGFESSLKKTVDLYIGTPYKYGGVTKKGMDCSGFVWRVFTDLGNKDFPRTSSANLSAIGVAVSRNRLQQGDLLFFRRGRRINHVGIYMGDNVFAHASAEKGVMYTLLDSEYFKRRLVCIRRI